MRLCVADDAYLYLHIDFCNLNVRSRSLSNDENREKKSKISSFRFY